MTLSQAIRQHTLESAQAGDWQQVAETLQAVTVRAEPRRCGSLESASAIANAGSNPAELLEKLRSDATGNLLYLKLADSGEAGGVMWAEPMLTVPYLEARVADLGRSVIDALINLSAPASHPWRDVTPEDCAAAYLVGADVLLAVNITGGITRCSMQVIRDGRQVKMQSLTEGQGSEADQALLTSIESAINTFLTEG